MLFRGVAISVLAMRLPRRAKSALLVMTDGQKMLAVADQAKVITVREEGGSMQAACSPFSAGGFHDDRLHLLGMVKTVGFQRVPAPQLPGLGWF